MRLSWSGCAFLSIGNGPVPCPVATRRCLGGRADSELLEGGIAGDLTIPDVVLASDAACEVTRMGNMKIWHPVGGDVAVGAGQETSKPGSRALSRESVVFCRPTEEIPGSWILTVTEGEG
jgi:hypothetical protein